MDNSDPINRLTTPDYESLAHLREAAEEVRKRLIARAEAADDPFAGTTLTLLDAENRLNDALPNGKLRNDLPEIQDRSWEDLTQNRETSDYWRAHCIVVANSMRRLAEKLGETDQELWYITGLLHDLDFLEFPHFSGETDDSKAHPMKMVIDLEDEIPPAAALAIMEHSPHLNYPSTSPLSHGLILADEHATMTGYGIDPDYPSESSELTSVLEEGSPITGYARKDMLERAKLALTALMRYFEGDETKIRFDSKGWQ